MTVDPLTRRALLPLKAKVAKLFDEGNWLELGTLTGSYQIVKSHDRLLRSLSWGDSDYEGNVLMVLNSIIDRDPSNIDVIADYVNNLEGGGTSLSSGSSDAPRFYIQPTAFDIRNVAQDADLVAVMMPFASQFTPVYEAIKRAAKYKDLACMRADDMWENSTVIQDIFDLIMRSHIVVCDFTGKNPNVFYETGIAHTLGKHVVPITQNGSDVPADVGHHRYLQYLNNGEGLHRFENELASRFQSIIAARH
ncbi:DNA primase (DnaG) [Neorhizobium galegae bv. officinalis]|uniref:DNA primase (DnaG) n=1 Tax=Neorhizobium galegae bv. officinalis TaxID=323656 RepID=A0A0T7FMM6_NEOGA|nr:hypothetical protein [Neorhizobium galegae]CDZ36272.1 DNA primase (DnaG) [Neorhizobium galegae bv. officinalis]